MLAVTSGKHTPWTMLVVSASANASVLEPLDKARELSELDGKTVEFMELNNASHEHKTNLQRFTSKCFDLAGCNCIFTISTDCSLEYPNFGNNSQINSDNAFVQDRVVTHKVRPDEMPVIY